jgi:hypothetical protein
MGSGQVCHKCAVHCDPMCAKALLFSTRADCFRAGLIVGKSLIFNGAKTRRTPSDSPTLTGNFCYLAPFLGACFNITRQQPIEVPELWPCVVSGSVHVVAGVARNKQHHGQPNLVLS